MKTGKNKLVDLEVFIDQKLGKKGSKKRDAFERGYETFKMGVMLQEMPTQAQPVTRATC